MSAPRGSRAIDAAPEAESGRGTREKDAWHAGKGKREGRKRSKVREVEREVWKHGTVRKKMGKK